jgi:hypothetical protein
MKLMEWSLFLLSVIFSNFEVRENYKATNKIETLNKEIVNHL